MKRSVGALASLAVFVGSMAILAGGVEAQTWCGAVQVTVSPPVVTTNLAVPYTFTVHNNENSDLNTRAFVVRFSFESSDRNLGSDYVSPHGIWTFDTPPIQAPSSATFTIAVSVTGVPSANPSDVGTCRYNLTVTGTESILQATWAFLATVLAVVIIVSVLIVVVVVLVGRGLKRTPPPMPPVPAYPGQPWQQPSAPPAGQVPTYPPSEPPRPPGT